MLFLAAAFRLRSDPQLHVNHEAGFFFLGVGMPKGLNACKREADRTYAQHARRRTSAAIANGTGAYAFSRAHARRLTVILCRQSLGEAVAVFEAAISATAAKQHTKELNTGQPRSTLVASS